MVNQLENPYEAPRSGLSEGDDSDGTPTGGLLFTPNQVRMGTFWGGPLAAIYYLKTNFEVLHKGAQAKKTIIYGIVCTGVIVGILPFVPDRFPQFIIPMTYCLVAGALVDKLQKSKSQISRSRIFSYRSNWKVAAVSVISMLLFFIILIIVMVGLDALEIITLD